MPAKRRACKVCDHAHVRAINRALADPANSARKVAQKYDVEPRTMQRHYSNCLKEIVAAVTAPDPDPGDDTEATTGLTPLTPRERAIGADIVFRVQALQDRTLALFAELPKSPTGKVTGACQLIREARHNYQLLARLTGKLDGGGHEGARTITFQEFRTLYLSVRQSKEGA